MTNKPKIGAHVSTRGGFGRAARFAWESGAACFQYFPKNPRSLRLKQLDLSDAESCASFCRDKGMVSIAHTPYPTNLAATAASRTIMVESLLNDLEIAEACGSLGIVVHFGHFSGIEPLQGYQNIIQCINETLENWDGQAKLLIENQAGNHGKEGKTLEELVKIRELSRYPEKIGFCLDTCHAFAAGIWNPEHTEEFIQRGTVLGYWEHLVAVHLNDSMYAFGLQRDRHANVGMGCIGDDGLRSLMIAEPFRRVAIALETGKGPDGTHRQEIAAVRTWYEEEGQQ
ncbi:endonuclease IV [Paenibacillus sp. P3E]|uniref:deoxyribonuclease IV n=1 Tax=unclassified Paenibacillus TaxID=185978 RepID=UPI0009389C87|nr:MULTISPECIES: deoxyribonuclease IV [unclassified Paenibacillus]OKP77865.1 endonuclease IV [Paenibacillus sp. P3E]OKP92473.1 endonuclease IV [Paenibacillus sp. P32E]